MFCFLTDVPVIDSQDIMVPESGDSQDIMVPESGDSQDIMVPESGESSSSIVCLDDSSQESAGKQKESTARPSGGATGSPVIKQAYFPAPSLDTTSKKRPLEDDFTSQKRPCLEVVNP